MEAGCQVGSQDIRGCFATSIERGLSCLHAGERYHLLGLCAAVWDAQQLDAQPDCAGAHEGDRLHHHLRGLLAIILFRFLQPEPEDLEKISPY